MTKNSSESNQVKTPKLRFPGFEGAWEEKKLGEICLIKTGNKDTQNKVENGKYPFFVRSNTVERIDSYSFDGEAILTSGDGVGVGKNFHYINGKFDWHQRVYCLHSFNKNYSGGFVYRFFSEKFFDRVKRMSAKNSVDSIRMEMIAGMKINFPILPEQQKIASFLGSVDEWLENLRNQKQNLEQYKNGIMQKIFSQEIRFKQEDGKDFPGWEYTKLGSICLIKKGSQLNREGLSIDTGYPVINGGVEPSGYTDTWNTKGDTITISEGGNSCGYVNFIKEDFWCGGHCYSLIELKNNMNQLFLFQYLKMIQKDIMELRVGSGLPNIQKKDIEKLKLQIPSLPEQQKIAEFLSSVDRLLESKQKQITEAEEWKRGMMQNLFV